MEMEVFLLPHRKGRYSLYSDAFPSAAAPSKPSDASGQKVTAPVAPPDAAGKSSISTAATGVWTFIKHAHETLTHAPHAREQLLKKVDALAQLERLKVVYPASLTGDKAREIYHQLVAEETEKHRRWLWVDGLLVPLSLVFSVIPGPNLLLAYLAWRSLAHYRSTKGGRRALRELRLELAPNEALDRLADVTRPAFLPGRRRRIRELGQELGLPQLEKAY